MAGAPRGGGRLKTWLVRSGQLALTVLVTWFIADRVGLGLAELEALDLSEWRPHALGLIASCALLFAAMVMNAALWSRIVVDLGGPRLPLPEAVSMFMIANLGRYVPGKVWQIAGLAALAKGRGVAPITATGAAVLGQGLSLVGATAIGLGALLTGPESFRTWGAVAAGVLALIVVLIAVPASFNAGSGLWFRLARTEAPEGLGSVHGLQWLVLYGINWIILALSFWLLVISFGISVEVVPVASAFAAAYVIGYLFILAPAGVGVREGFLVVFLTPHIGVGPAGAIAIIQRVWTTAVEIAPATYFWSRHVSRSATRPESHIEESVDE